MSTVATLPIEETKKDFTQGFKCAGKIFDNVDQELSLEVLEELLDAPTEKYATHYTRAPWYANVWHEDGKWFEQVRLQGDTVGVYSSDDLEALFAKVNEVHGLE